MSLVSPEARPSSTLISMPRAISSSSDMKSLMPSLVRRAIKH